MSILFVILHIAGVFAVTGALFFTQTVATIWHLERVKKRNEAEMSWKIGVSHQELDDNNETGILNGKIFGFLSQKYSNELLSNRVSDLCGVVLKIWSNSGNVIQIIVFLMVLWGSFSGKRDDIVMLWIVPVLCFAWWVVAVVFSLICSVLTGRLPGEAKEGRQQLLNVQMKS
jgi:hypothetical protein